VVGLDGDGCLAPPIRHGPSLAPRESSASWRHGRMRRRRRRSGVRPRARRFHTRRPVCRGLVRRVGEYGGQRRRWPSRPSRSQAGIGFELERTGRRLSLPGREIRQEGTGGGGPSRCWHRRWPPTLCRVSRRGGWRSRPATRRGPRSSKPQVRAWVRQLVRWSRLPRWTLDAGPSTSRWIDFVPQEVREGGTMTTHALIARA
jgi:hypothetical protein